MPAAPAWMLMQMPMPMSSPLPMQWRVHVQAKVCVHVQRAVEYRDSKGPRRKGTHGRVLRILAGITKRPGGHVGGT
ncbi:hypothetical protein DEJ46_33680 [Streptomyces venezuelae]|uniref:Uncharacterized protein n=1 Tax=Streptomyces venezuelae TaxID=54571 RepID=A0A5P2B0J8_STRVZ|nr:hypothetical protein DEJ46_33680 [Streptomyces venezuelae]